MLFVCILYLISPLVAYCFPVVALAFLVYRLVIGTCLPKAGLKPKSHRTFRSVYCVHVPKQHIESSFMQDALQNANNMNAEKDNLVEEHPKDIHNRPLDERYRKCSLDDCNVKRQIESLDDHGINKAVGRIEDAEKSLMDLGIERTKRLESLMEKRRQSKFQVIRNAMGVGSGISSLHIPKKNPFLKNTGDPSSAPTYMIKNNPFDLPYDPHEEKPILTGDGFQDEFRSTHHKEPQSTNETYYDTEFAIRQLTRLGTSKVANKEDDKKQPQEKCLIPNVVTGDNHAIEEGESSNKVVDHTKQHEVDHDVVSSDQSTSSTSSSEDERILRPNKEAILHCLSMSRMRAISLGKSLHRNAESFDCGPSALFDKSKTDRFFFGSNKWAHYGSTNSVASDMQVEVSELSSPPSTTMSLDEEGKRSLVNSTNPSETDLNDVRFRDIDDLSEQGTIEPVFTRRSLDPNRFESTMKPEKINEKDAHCFTEEDR